MLLSPVLIKQGHRHHEVALQSLLDTSFGTKRHEKAASILRAQAKQVQDLWFIAEQRALLKASIQFWPLNIVSRNICEDALLLGPLVVDEGLQGLGIGRALVKTGLSIAALRGYRHITLIGDPNYYQRFGFSNRHTQGLIFPGIDDQKRLLHRQIAHGPVLPEDALILPAFSEPDEGEQCDANEKSKPIGYQPDLGDLQNAPRLISG